MIDGGHRQALYRFGLALAVACLAGCVRAKPPRTVVPQARSVAPEIASPAALKATSEPDSGQVGGALPGDEQSSATAVPPTSDSPPAQPKAGPSPTSRQKDREPPAPPDTPPPQGDVTHRVSSGETLSGIAQQYGVSSWSIMKRNGVWDPNKVFVGQTLVIPLGVDPSVTPRIETVAHTVVKGDSIAQLARTYRTTPAEIKSLNTSTITDPDHLIEGMVLTIRVGTAPPVQTHTVRPGESLSQIAQRYGVTTQALIQTNSLRDPNTVRVGQLLIIPAR